MILIIPGIEHFCKGSQRNCLFIFMPNRVLIVLHYAFEPFVQFLLNRKNSEEKVASRSNLCFLYIRKYKGLSNQEMELISFPGKDTIHRERQRQGSQTVQ